MKLEKSIEAMVDSDIGYDLPNWMVSFFEQIDSSDVFVNATDSPGKGNVI